MSDIILYVINIDPLKAFARTTWKVLLITEMIKSRDWKK